MTVSKKHTPELDDKVADVIDVVSYTELEPVKNSSASAADQNRQMQFRLYLLVPFIFLTVTLLGGLRLASPDNSFVFLKPALLCLIFALVLLVLFVRGGLIALDEWVNEQFPILTNIANSVVLVTLFAASAQIFNSVMPEQGLPFWVVAFCFLWTLWNNLFADFDNKKLLRSIVALFGFAFVAKYLVLANLTAPASESWLRGMIENPAQEAFTWILALPKYSAGTGYIQFFTVLLYFIGLLILPRSLRLNN
ncbi:MAG: hypothetical protein WBD27_06530 [Pyrinomonadaceae bacterium]